MVQGIVSAGIIIFMGVASVLFLLLLLYVGYLIVGGSSSTRSVTAHSTGSVSKGTGETVVDVDDDADGRDADDGGFGEGGFGGGFGGDGGGE